MRQYELHRNRTTRASVAALEARYARLSRPVPLERSILDNADTYANALKRIRSSARHENLALIVKPIVDGLTELQYERDRAGNTTLLGQIMHLAVERHTTLGVIARTTVESVYLTVLVTIAAQIGNAMDLISGRFGAADELLAARDTRPEAINTLGVRIGRIFSLNATSNCYLGAGGNIVPFGLHRPDNDISQGTFDIQHDSMLTAVQIVDEISDAVRRAFVAKRKIPEPRLTSTQANQVWRDDRYMPGGQ